MNQIDQIWGVPNFFFEIEKSILIPKISEFENQFRIREPSKTSEIAN